MKTLIIIPCYNEAENIERVVNNLTENYSQYDYVIINDGSKDETADICKKNNYNLIDLPLNLGIGGAVQTGYRYALSSGYDIAVQLDGDGQHDPAWVKELIEPIEAGNADLVIGSRFLVKEGFQSTIMRRAGISFFRILIFCLTGKKITDATSGFRALNRNTMMLFDNFYAKDYPEPESNTLALRNKLRVVEVPVVMRERQGGVSSITGIKSVYYMFKVSIGIIISLLKPRYKHIRGG